MNKGTNLQDVVVHKYFKICRWDLPQNAHLFDKKPKLVPEVKDLIYIAVNSLSLKLYNCFAISLSLRHQQRYNAIR